MKLAVFDFCDTMIRGQSMGLFFEFLIKRASYWVKLKHRFGVLKGMDESLKDLEYKNWFLSHFKGYSEKKMRLLARMFSDKVLSNRKRNELWKKLSELKSSGYKVIIASGGLNIYLEALFENFDDCILVSSKLAFLEGRFLGEIEGEECLGEEKLKQVESVLNNLSDVDWQESIAYSDHFNDLPLLKKVGKPYAVISKTEQSKWEEALPGVNFVFI